MFPAWPLKRSLNVYVKQPWCVPTKKSNFVVGQQWRHRWKGLDLGSNICQYEICGQFLLPRCALWTLYLWLFWRLIVQQQNMLETWGQQFWKALHLYYHTRQQTNRGRHWVGSKPIKNMISPSYQYKSQNQTRQACFPPLKHIISLQSSWSHSQKIETLALIKFILSTGSTKVYYVS